MVKILKISFKDAKLFPYSKKNKDFIYNFVRSNRDNQLMFKNPITVHQISNMLHKMCGERPVPSFRYVVYDRISDIFNMANNSYLKIDSIKQFNKSKNKDEFIKENIQIKKSADDSWNTNPTVFWKKIEKYMGIYYDDLLNKWSLIIGYDVRNKPFMSYKSSAIDNEDYNDLISWLKNIKKTPIINFLTKLEPKVDEITKNKSIGETTPLAISNINNLSGVVYVPISDDMLAKIIYNTVTLLDGGLATIEGIYYDDELDDDTLDGFNILSEISDDKVENIIW